MFAFSVASGTIGFVASVEVFLLYEPKLLSPPKVLFISLNLIGPDVKYGPSMLRRTDIISGLW